MTILITGGEGVIGQALLQVWPDAIPLSSRYCNVTMPHTVQAVFEEYKPSVVIHAAAVTDHQCPNMGLMMRTNVIGTRNVFDACQKVCAEPVYLSTHYVYPGTEGNYRENAEVDPIGLYAWSKYLGELVAQDYAALIIRGSWYTYETRLKYWEENGALTDAWCSRTDTETAASQIKNLVDRHANGVYNIGGPRRSFYEIMQDEGLSCRPICRADLSLHLPYTFPKDTSVSTDKYDALVQSS